MTSYTVTRTDPATGVWTYGWKRAEILSAAGNGITLLVGSALVTFEAIRRPLDPPEVAGLAVLLVALLGVAVNIVATWVIAKANRSSMNVARPDRGEQRGRPDSACATQQPPSWTAPTGSTCRLR